MRREAWNFQTLHRLRRQKSGGTDEAPPQIAHPARFFTDAVVSLTLFPSLTYCWRRTDALPFASAEADPFSLP